MLLRRPADEAAAVVGAVVDVAAAVAADASHPASTKWRWRPTARRTAGRSRYGRIRYWQLRN